MISTSIYAKDFVSDLTYRQIILDHFSGVFVPGLSALSKYAAGDYAPQRQALPLLQGKQLRGGLINNKQTASAKRWADWAKGQTEAERLRSITAPIAKFPEVTRWTVGNECWRAGIGRALAQVDRYLHIRATRYVAEAYPDVEIWLGEYGLREKGALDNLLSEVDRQRKLGGRVDGVIWIQYVDLAHKEQDQPHRAGLKQSMFNAFPQVSMLTFAQSIERLQAAGLKVAQETAVLTGRPNPRKLAAQRSIYGRLIQLCRQKDVELMLWWATGRHLGPWHSPIDGVDSPGLWDRQLRPKFPELIETVAAGSASRPRL